jgi:hypothetical protein
MKIYAIDIRCALYFVWIVGFVRLAGSAVAREVALKLPDVPALPRFTQSLAREVLRDPSHFRARLAGKNAPDEIDRMLDDALVPIGPPPSLRERQAMVAVLQQKLQAREATFPPGARPPPAFRNQLHRYVRLLNEVKAEMGQPPQPGAATASSS